VRKTEKDCKSTSTCWSHEALPEYLMKQFHIHRHTLCVCLREAGISQWFHVLSDDQLDHIIQLIKQVKPQAGYWYVVGYLCSFGLWIQLWHILKSLCWIDPVGCVLQQQQITRQRKYYVKQPNSLWHLDGHHKLIKWGFVIHGIIDGYSRVVCIISIPCVISIFNLFLR
jgi:hypothetical protein